MVAITLALRNVWRRRERSLLTLVGVLLAVGTFVAMVSLAEGMYRRVSLELDGRAVDIYVVPKTAAPLPTGPVGTIGMTSDTINVSWLEKIKKLENISDVCPIVRAQWTGKKGMIMTLGIDGSKWRTFMPDLQNVEGETLLTGNRVVLGQGVATSENLKIGEELKSGQTSYKVAGIVAAGAGFQDYFAYIPIQSAYKFTDGKGASEVWVKLKDPHRVSEVVRVIEGMKIPGAKILSRKDYLGTANDYIQYAWYLQFAVSAIGVLISITAAMNTMLMSTYERMREFATLRAIGAPRSTVVAMVMTESIILSVSGGILGIVFGIIGSGLVNRLVVVILQLPFPLASITVPLIAEAIALSVFVGVVGAAIPSVLVWKINIVNGLRWE
ncbi:ABC transporter permease [bacterium]|nr:ABC transporter permease [bacterium]